MEYWAQIHPDSNSYAISTMGRVWSAKHGVMKTPINNHDYPHCNIMVNGESFRVMVHHEMGKVFLPNPEKKRTINHKNGIRWDNMLDNLEWATHTEQIVHSFNVLGRKAAKNNHRRKEVLAYREDSSIVLDFVGIRECARFFEIPYQAVQKGIKIPSRTYFGWRFELLSDPNWVAKTGKKY